MYNAWVLGGKPRIETINLAKITITFFLRICSCVDFIVNCSEQSTETPKARISGSKKRRMMAIPQQNRKVQGYKKSSKIIKTPTQKSFVRTGRLITGGFINNGNKLKHI